MSAREISHALEAACAIAAARALTTKANDFAADVQMHLAVARDHARHAGRQAALAGQALGDASPHILENRRPGKKDDLGHAYQSGYAEAEQLLMLGSLSTEALASCQQARAALDRAIHAHDAGVMHIVVDTVFRLAADHPGVALPFFDDVPELDNLSQAAAVWVAATHAHDAARAEAATRQAAWEASLPSGAELRRAVAAEANGEGASFNFQGYTLWHEPDHGGWSVTNAYGVDNCRFLTSERDFQHLVDTVLRGLDIGPVPPGCEEPDEPADDRADIDAMSACYEAEMALLARLGIPDDEPLRVSV